MNLLIIDDNPNQLFSLHIALKMKGHCVTIALSGQEALKILMENHSQFDVVLTDYAMPGMSGLELLEQIRKGYESLPVIMMTAYGKKELVIAALQSGCAGYVEKPFTLEQLMPEIERVTAPARKKTLLGEVTTQLRTQIEKVNDKLTVIAGGAELALMDLEKEKIEYVKTQLRDISSLAHEIGEANEIMMRTMIAVGKEAPPEPTDCPPDNSR